MNITFTLNGYKRTVDAPAGLSLQVLLKRMGIHSVRNSDDGEGFAGVREAWLKAGLSIGTPLAVHFNDDACILMAVHSRVNHVLFGFRTPVKGDISLISMFVCSTDTGHFDFDNDRTRFEMVRVGKFLTFHLPRACHDNCIDLFGFVHIFLL